MSNLRVCFHSYSERFVKRFLSKVDVRDENECWPWLGAVSKKLNRGLIKFEGPTEYAYRVSYKIFKEKIPKGFDICHSCDNGIYCNPKHLWPGTRKQNMEDCIKKGRNSLPPRFEGEQHPQAKLTEEDVLEIKILLKQNRTQKIIALQFNVTPTSISYIKRGKTWRHLL